MAAVAKGEAEVTNIYSILIALAVLVTCGPLAMYLADKAGIPDYGCNPDQKPGWTVLYILALLPASLAFGFLALMALVGFASGAIAHDHARPDLDAWFNRLASGKGLCCSLADGEAVADPDWESKNGHHRVRLGVEWIDVPDDAVITEPNRAGRTMVWPLKGYLGTTIRCFMPGSMT
jgi:hypothetical protein